MEAHGIPHRLEGPVRLRSRQQAPERYGFAARSARAFDLKMNNYWIILLTIVIAGVAARLIVPQVIASVKGMRQYKEAEPLVEQVWPLAADMRAYYSEHGSNACSLADITSDPMILTLAKYNPEFAPTETNIFKMMVNESFGFTISADFAPQWIFPK